MELLDNLLLGFSVAISPRIWPMPCWAAFWVR